MRIAAVWFGIALWLASGSASASPSSRSSQPPKIGPAWDDSYVRSFYSSAGLSKGPALIGDGLDLEMIPMDAALDNFSNRRASSIAEGCKNVYPDAWSRIRCASEGVSYALRKEGGGFFGGLHQRTYCRDHARAFVEVFQRLGLPGSYVGYQTIIGHVTNRVSVLGTDGRVYAYVIDTGWDPAQVHALGDHARSLAKQGRLPDVRMSAASWDPRFWPLPGAPGGAFALGASLPFLPEGLESSTPIDTLHWFEHVGVSVAHGGEEVGHLASHVAGGIGGLFHDVASATGIDAPRTADTRVADGFSGGDATSGRNEGFKH